MPGVESVIDAQEKALKDALKLVNDELDILIIQLGRDDPTVIQLSKLQVEINKSFEPFNAAAEEATAFRGQMAPLKDRLSGAGISTSFTTVDTSIIKAYSDIAFQEVSGLSSQYAARITSTVYEGSLLGTSVNDIREQVSQLLVGGTDLKGVPMSSHATTITNTRYMELDRTVMKKKGDEAGAKFYRYSGSLIKDSRQFCKDKAGQKFTKEEVEAWQDQEWAGKKEGDIFIVLGGWGCRHSLIPVLTED